MKKRLISILAALTIFIGCTGAVIAQPTSETVTADLSPNFTIVVDGVERDFYNADGDEVHPIVYNGTTYLPLRAIGELMDKNVNWDQSTLTITLSGSRDDGTVSGTKDKSAKEKEITVEIRYDFTIVVDGVVQTFKNVTGTAVYPILYEGSTYLPIRAIGELMGKSVSWDGDTKTVYIGGTGSSGSIVTDADSFNSNTVTDADSFGSAQDDKLIGGQRPIPGQTADGQMPDGEIPQGGERPADDRNGQMPQSTQRPANGSGTAQSYEADITLDEAKAIAIADAGVDESTVTYKKAKLDYDDGVLVYDIEFYSGGTEYEYEINASTGAIVSKDIDAKKSGAAASSGTSSADVGITLDDAKAIALTHAGLAASDVTFTKAKLDTDDGVKVYEIEFRYGKTEYEYEINASTGAIVSYDKDND